MKQINISKIIRLLLISTKLSRTKLSKKLKISRFTIYKWERGKIKNISPLNLYNLANLCKENNIFVYFPKINHVKTIRLTMRLSLFEFSKLLFKNKNHATLINNWESNKSVPDLVNALKIIKLANKIDYDLKIEDLINKEDK